MKLDFNGLLTKKIQVESWFLPAVFGVSLVIGGLLGFTAIVIGWIILLFLGIAWYAGRPKEKASAQREPANREA